MNKPLRLSLSVLGGLFLGYLLAVAGFRWWLTNKYPDLYLSVIPKKLTQYNVAQTFSPTEWEQQQFKNISFWIPVSWELLKTTEQYVVWGNQSIQLIVHRTYRTPYRHYRNSLYGTWNIRSLIDRGVFLPKLDTQNPRIYEQQIGPWETFIFPSQGKCTFEIFQDDAAIGVTFVTNSQDGEPQEFMKDIVARIKLQSDPGK